MDIFYKIITSPIGMYLLVESEKGISFVEHLDSEEAESQKMNRAEATRKDTPLLLETARQMEEYFKGERHTFDIPMDTHGTPFQQQVWLELQRIPYGEVRTYKEIAAAIDNPKAVRAVGMANNRNPISIMTPCHRVIGSNGSLVGYAGGLDVKEFLLNLETVNQFNTH
ncbi:methylated-DNA--[protein]-cysteine S-methyltransferase [Jeotgalibaca sp. MA1X17-3]|uniref:methylated-DNA--[protein]-cysteine S-methyltransferase n=1 Tax=Jeotgalibaca sp. MA1X17-3 TaxID=2908211 RepID=UPI001F40D780|nr:methylated-DNA--[protein]-cysteine S-methyltransferase [Jeotgalibaca sp. MA1X17-3]UJF15363.1 methylated-DNA--[protein]-cysteine S-methyltransferase [Jeotgalibaca sp. MA1X17-3]